MVVLASGQLLALLARRFWNRYSRNNYRPLPTYNIFGRFDGRLNDGRGYYDGDYYGQPYYSGYRGPAYDYGYGGYGHAYGGYNRGGNIGANIGGAIGGQGGAAIGNAIGRAIDD